MQKLYIIRKYVFASSAEKAIKLERKAPVDDIWLDDDWRKEAMRLTQQSITVGFTPKKKSNGTPRR